MGNTSVDLSIVTDPALVLSDDPDKPNTRDPGDDPVLLIANTHLTDGIRLLKDGEAKVTVLPQNRLRHCPLKASVMMLSETRHIVTGRSHLQEGQQTVRLDQDMYSPIETVEIVPADDISPAVWSIQSKPQDGHGKTIETPIPVYVKAKTKNAQDRQLVFTDYATASELTHWLKAQQAAVGKDVHLNEMEFDVEANHTIVPTKLTKEDCTPPSKQEAKNTPPSP